MPVSLPALPPEVREGFLRRLDDFLRPGDDLLRFIESHPGSILGIPIYRILPDLLRAGARTEAATPIGWRVLAASHSQGIAADVTPLPLRGRYAITRAAVSPNVTALIELIQQVLDRPLPPNQDFELRLLRMKAAYLEIAWLRSRTPEPDLFVPITSGLTALQSRETYTAGQVFPHARTAAERTTGFRRP